MKLAKRLAQPVAGLLVAVALGACTGAPHSEQTAAQAAESNRVKSEQLIAKAQEYTAVGQFDDAINLYKESVLLYPQQPYAWYNLGVLCNRQKRLGESAEAWQMAATIDATDPRPHFALGLQVQELGWLDDAAEFYSQSLHRDPNFLPALKKAVEVDQLKGVYTDVTLDRIRRALPQETDPKWVVFLRQTQLKTQERVSRAGGNTGG